MSRQLELLIAAFLYYSGIVKLARWLTQRSGKRLVVLCYHGASGGHLRRHLLYLSRHYRVLHLEAALEELYSLSKKDNNQMKDRRTLLVLTFDDGYHDNYTEGFILAQELQIPITVFLVPGYIESGSRFWWQEPTYLLRNVELSEVTIEGHTYHLSDLDERSALLQAISIRLEKAPSIKEREEFLISIRSILAGSPKMNTQEEPARPLTWTEVREMEKSEWISFGSHTMNHPTLACLIDPTEIQSEVSECRTVIEQQLGHPVRTFAYPIGKWEHIGEKGLHAVQEAKYDWALTTMHGLNSPRTNPHLLHRIVVDVDQHWLLVASKASGAWDFLVGLCLTPKTLFKKTFSNK